MAEVTLAIAVLAGLGSFVAPCILPMIPAFLAYLSGTAITELAGKGEAKTISINRTNVIMNTVFFVLGFHFFILARQAHLEVESLQLMQADL